MRRPFFLMRCPSPIEHSCAKGKFGLEIDLRVKLELIPADAAERDPIFFFGTLMHPSVLTKVVDRPILDTELMPAVLSGYRRFTAQDASYPVIKPDATSEVEGLLLKTASARDIARINHFEDEEYFAQKVELRAQNESISAWVYLGLETMPASSAPWELDRWADHHLDAFMPRIDFWMKDSPA